MIKQYDVYYITYYYLQPVLVNFFCRALWITGRREVYHNMKNIHKLPNKAEK